MDWLKAAQQLRDEGQPGVLVTVAEVRGHAPREAGAKMVVGRERTWGSVGGGNLEATAVARAREMIGSGAAEPQLHEDGKAIDWYAGWTGEVHKVADLEPAYAAAGTSIATCTTLTTSSTRA